MERSSFFNAELVGESYDRVYLAEDFARYFSSFIGNGVFPNPATGLQVVADNKNMHVIIKPGEAWINGYFYENTDDLILQVNVADGVLNRIDRVVLRLDFINREMKAYIKSSKFATVPTAPRLTRNADIYEIALADVMINKGAIKISQVAITDLRPNKELCGFVRGTVEEIDTTGLFTQFEKGFEAWFEHMKDTIEGDAAANLANKTWELNSDLNKTNKRIDNSNDEIAKINNSKDKALGIATLDDNKRLLQDINYNKIIGNPNLKKEEVIATGSLISSPYKNDSKTIPINVGEWLKISITVNYTIQGHSSSTGTTISSMTITNMVDGKATTLANDSERNGNEKIATYKADYGEAWAIPEVKSLIDVYRHIGVTGTDWGGLKDNKLNTLTITVKQEGSTTGKFSKAIANYTITGIRR